MAKTAQQELLAKVRSLEEQLAKVRISHSRTRDELSEMKNHYTNLVNGVNKRFEVIEETFRNKK